MADASISYVFISYKREDEPRVTPLVSALESHGLAVWWDKALPAGESWRDNIETALAGAKAAVAVWTAASTGRDGTFVKDESARAQRRGILVSVALDKVQLPLGFGEGHVVDLSRWQRSRSDPFLLDLVAALRAKIDGRPVPPAKGPIARLRKKWLTLGGAASACALVFSAFAANTLGSQKALCEVPFGDHVIADACGKLGWGGQPSRAKRLAWESRPKGSCEALQRHINNFPGGALSSRASALLAAKSEVETTRWTSSPSPMRLKLFVGKMEPEAGTEAAAKAAALERSQEQAREACQPIEASGTIRLTRVGVEPPQSWSCEKLHRGFLCGFDGWALCSAEVLERTKTTVCDANATN